MNTKNMFDGIERMFILKKESVKEPDFYMNADIEQVVFENSEEKVEISNRLYSRIPKKIEKNSAGDVVNELYEKSYIGSRTRIEESRLAIANESNGSIGEWVHAGTRSNTEARRKRQNYYQ